VSGRLLVLGMCRQSEVDAGVLAHKLRIENVSLVLMECLVKFQHETSHMHLLASSLTLMVIKSQMLGWPGHVIHKVNEKYI
jgi:hypothetical protein